MNNESRLNLWNMDKAEEAAKGNGRWYGMDAPMPSDARELILVMNNDNANGPTRPILCEAIKVNPEMYGTLARNWLTAAKAVSAKNEDDASDDMKLLKRFIGIMEASLPQG